MIKIPIKVMARFLRSSPRNQSLLLRNHKYQPPDLQTALRYHRIARSTIMRLLRREVSLEEVEAEVASMRSEAEDAPGFVSTRLISNADIIGNWIAKQAHRHLEIQSACPFELRRLDVEVTATPNIFLGDHPKPATDDHLKTGH